MDPAYAYIPIDRQLALVRGTTLAEKTHGAALFADLSGFTPLTEALVRALGPQRGAEELTRQLNLVYDELIFQVQQYRGVVIGFSGDAITCWFDQDRGERAVAAAMAMQTAMREFSAIPLPNGGTVALALKAAVVSGPVHRFTVGDPNIQLVDVLAGDTLDRLAEAEHHAEKGDIVLDQATASQIGNVVQVREWRPSDHTLYAVVDALTISVPAEPWETLDPGTLDETFVRPWILPPVYARLQSGQASFLAELRPAVALFMRFGGFDFDDDPDAATKLDAYIQWVQQIITQYDGVMIQLTIGDKGSYLYAAFGAPIAHIDDAVRALRAARDLQTTPDHFDYITAPQIGISRGRMRVGPYGSVMRRTYGVLGDEVNVAARLMQAAAPGQIIVTERLAEAAGKSVSFAPLPPLRVKGKSEPLHVLALADDGDGARRPLVDLSALLPMVGRNAEMDIIAERIQVALRSEGQIIGIVGEAGIGKSRVAAEALKVARMNGFVQYTSECQSFGINTRYDVWTSIWQDLFSLDPRASLDVQQEQLTSALDELDPSFRLRLPLLGAVLNVPLPDNDLTRSLDAQVRNQLLQTLLVDILRARTSSTPVAFLLEDLQWIDALSLELLELLIRETGDRPILFVLTLRPAEATRAQLMELVQLPNATLLPLTDLESKEAAQLVQNKLAQFGEKPDFSTTTDPALAPLVKLVTARAGGNPFYIEELLNYFHDRGLDPRVENTFEQLELPDSLHSLILSRIDQLAESQKVTLKVASIIGRVFLVKWLWGVYPELGDAPRVYDDLDTLSRLDLTPLEQPDPDRSHIFRHVVSYQVTYESQPYATRAELHGHLGQFIEECYSNEIDRYVDLLALHFDRSELTDKKRHYLLKAGEQAQAAYANEAAIDYYRRALPLTSGAECIGVMLKLGQVYELTGQWDDANAFYRQGLELSQQTQDAHNQARSEAALGSLMRKRGEFVLAWNWLDRARLRFEDGPDYGGIAQVLHESGTLAAQQGAYDAARSFYERSLGIRRAQAETRLIASLLSNLAILSRFQNDYYTAGQLNEEALALRRKIGDRLGVAVSLNNLGLLRRYQGQHGEARKLLEESLATWREIGDRSYLANTLTSLAEVALDQRDVAFAHPLLVEGLTIYRALGEKRSIAFLLENFARAAALQGQATRALQLAGAASALRQAIGSPLSATEQTNLEHHLEQARAALGSESAQVAWDQGFLLRQDAAIQLALE